MSDPINNNAAKVSASTTSVNTGANPSVPCEAQSSSPAQTQALSPTEKIQTEETQSVPAYSVNNVSSVQTPINAGTGNTSSASTLRTNFAYYAKNKIANNTWIKEANAVLA